MSERKVNVAKRRIRNKSEHSLVKTEITKAEKLIFAGDTANAAGEVRAAVISLDKAAEKGILHKNNAARRKSRLVKKLNAATAPKEQAEKK